MGDYISKFRDELESNKIAGFDNILSKNIGDLTDGLGLVGG